MVPCDWNSVLSVSLIIILCNFESITALRCFSCHSSTDSNCKYVQTELTSPASDCATQCYVFLSADAGLTERGCLGSSSSSCSQLPLGATCEKCTTDLCNSQQLSYDKCAVCDSTIDPDCDITSSTTKVIPCPGSTGQKRGCYRYSESWDGQVTRGCVSQLSVELFRVCSENGPNCKTCEGDGCNLKRTFDSPLPLYVVSLRNGHSLFYSAIHHRCLPELLYLRLGRRSPMLELGSAGGSRVCWIL